jgi:hypothetical protein
VALVLLVFAFSLFLMSWSSQLVAGTRTAPAWFPRVAKLMCAMTSRRECLVPGVQTLPALIESASSAGILANPLVTTSERKDP